MSYTDYLNQGATPLMSGPERASACILIVESDADSRHRLKQMLIGLQFMQVFDAPNHAMALQKIAERPITHVIFEAKKTNMPAADFLTAILACDEKVIALPASSDPSVDDVFNLLIIGARGYIVKPYSSDGVDVAISMATKGEALSDAILFAKDRNEALSSLMMTALDKLALTYKQSSQFQTAQREMSKRVLNFKRSVEISRTFAQGGPIKLMESLIEFCLNRAEGPASKLGRIRKRLGKGKQQKLPRIVPTETDESIEIQETSELHQEQGNEVVSLDTPASEPHSS